jgi:hypothetical protein
MIRIHLTSTLAAALLSASAAFPSAVTAQQSSPAGKSSVTVTVEVDPWMVAWRRDQASSRIARANLRELNNALEPYRMTYQDLTDGERTEVRRAFADLLPSERFPAYRLNAPQARAIAYLALGPARGRRGDHRCEYTVRPAPAPAPVQAGQPSTPSWCDAALDTMSRNAAWIHTTILALGRSGAARRAKAEELEDFKAMAERAREIVLATPRCGCRTGDEADQLLTGTREVLDAYAASSMPAWMTLHSEQVQRISKLADSVERSILRCLSSR